MEKVYTHDFYMGRNANTLYSANKILNILHDVVKGAAILDLGCGVGTWSSVAKKQGAASVLGIDGPWIDEALLEININEFMKKDITIETLDLDKNYDLVIWLENVEHLPKGVGESILNEVSKHSTAVLFSGAIPWQGGRRHINEQWQSYWANLFIKNGLLPHDIIRPKIWDDKRIPFWYKQNILFYCKQDGPYTEFYSKDNIANPMILDIIHPYIWNCRNNKTPGIKTSFQHLKTAIKRKFIT